MMFIRVPSVQVNVQSRTFYLSFQEKYFFAILGTHVFAMKEYYSLQLSFSTSNPPSKSRPCRVFSQIPKRARDSNILIHKKEQTGRHQRCNMSLGVQSLVTETQTVHFLPTVALCTRSFSDWNLLIQE